MNKSKFDVKNRRFAYSLRFTDALVAERSKAYYLAKASRRGMREEQRGEKTKPPKQKQRGSGGGDAAADGVQQQPLSDKLVAPRAAIFVLIGVCGPRLSSGTGVGVQSECFGEPRGCNFSRIPFCTRSPEVSLVTLFYTLFANEAAKSRPSSTLPAKRLAAVEAHRARSDVKYRIAK